ncbi:sigma-70 family RNA polymerase sigma factor [Streptomyces sp. NPDC003077]|uniref:RNA polymerase sigma factor n=1 Tax=Streptomyces sp. NPDC003077 TaxID=3154443 RepID=UPI0033BC5948
MAGWDEALTALVRVRGVALRRYAYVLTADDQAAEDLVQEALVRVFARRRVVEIEAVEAYVRAVMLRCYLDGYRRRQRWRRLVPRLATPEADGGGIAEVPGQVDAAAALGALSPRQRACVVLRFYEDLAVGDIAARLGVAEGTVKRHLADAMARLTPLLVTNGGEGHAG